MNDEKWMRCALDEARAAALHGDVPVGAVIVKDDKIIAAAHNTREAVGDATAHAELSAIAAACHALSGWRLAGCTLYVTLEPCPMCAGAIINSRLPRVVFGAKDARAGALGSVMNLASYPLNHKPEVCPGVLADECRTLLTDFFTERR